MHHQDRLALCLHVQLSAFQPRATHHRVGPGWLCATMWGSQHCSQDQWEPSAVESGQASSVPPSASPHWSAGSPMWSHGVGPAQWHMALCGSGTPVGSYTIRPGWLHAAPKAPRTAALWEPHAIGPGWAGLTPCHHMQTPALQLGAAHHQAGPGWLCAAKCNPQDLAGALLGGSVCLQS